LSVDLEKRDATLLTVFVPTTVSTGAIQGLCWLMTSGAVYTYINESLGHESVIDKFVNLSDYLPGSTRCMCNISVESRNQRIDGSVCVIWKAARRPRSGPLFDKYRKDKSAYRRAIRSKQQSELY